MSIHISFTLKPRKRLFKTTVLDFDAVVAELKNLGKDEQIRIEEKSHDIKVTLCAQGFFWITYKMEKNELTGDIQTNVAGPGFHAASIDFLEKLSAKLRLKLKVEDDTGYVKHKDFERMRREHFYPWLNHIMGLLCGQFNKTDFKICWDEDSYSPTVIPGTVITPIRRFTLEEVRQFMELGADLFAKEFFVWNEKKRDALFYRNSAIAEMNIRCHFMPSDRSIWDGIENAVCIDLLEKALSYDSKLPFPKSEYLLLCKLQDQTPMDLNGVPELRHDCEIGYRRQEVLHQVGFFTYSVYGCCLEKYDREKNSKLYYDDAVGHWHNIRIASFQFNDKKAEFSKDMFSSPNIEEIQDFRVSEGICKLAVYKPVPMEKSPEGYYYEMSAQMILENQLLLVTQTYCRKEEKEKILDWFRRIEGNRRRRL